MKQPNSRPFAMLCVAFTLLFAACGSEASITAEPAATSTPAVENETPSTTRGSHDHDMGHGDMIEVAGDTAPTVSIEVTPDTTSGVNVQVETSNFTIAPQSVSTAHVEGEGHMHLIVDGEKVQRFYNEWIHVPNLAAGEHTIEVELNANTHAPYATGGERIAASETVTVDEPAPHDHSANDGIDAGAAQVSLTLVPVAKAGDGNNFEVALSEFALAPEKVGGDHVPGEGHLHLFVDGVKQERIYGNWFHVPELDRDEYAVTVELSANNHSPYTNEGDPVGATIVVTSGSATVAAEEPVTPDADAAVLVEATSLNGAVMVMSEGTATDRVSVAVGDTVRIVATSDTADHVHVHGYDIFADLVPGEPSTIEFDATIPGIVEIELEDSGLLLFELSAS